MVLLKILVIVLLLVVFPLLLGELFTESAEYRDGIETLHEFVAETAGADNVNDFFIALTRN